MTDDDRDALRERLSENLAERVGTYDWDAALAKYLEEQ